MTNRTSFATTPDSPFGKMVKITPSDTATIEPPKSLLIVSGGDLNVQFEGDAGPQVLPDLPRYFEIRGYLVKVMATGTTATDIRACY